MASARSAIQGRRRLSLFIWTPCWRLSVKEGARKDLDACVAVEWH
jgi:hypothetical protein